MPDEPLVKARVAGREAAAALTSLYLEEGARLAKEHGPHGAAAALELIRGLRDTFLAICPLAPDPKPAAAVAPVAVPQKPQVRDRRSESLEWDEYDIPYEYMLVAFDAVVKAVRPESVLIGERFLPKSVLLDHKLLSEGDLVGEWPVKKWFARKELI